MPECTIRLKMNAEQIPFYPDPLTKHPARLPDIKTQDDSKINLDLDLDIYKGLRKILCIKKV